MMVMMMNMHCIDDTAAVCGLLLLITNNTVSLIGGLIKKLKTSLCVLMASSHLWNYIKMVNAVSLSIEILTRIYDSQVP